VKDRVALQIVREALADGVLVPGGLITEGTVGSTGVSLALVRGRLVQAPGTIFCCCWLFQAVAFLETNFRCCLSISSHPTATAC
jgi:hypothetical protein